MENRIKDTDEHCRLVALGAAQISYAITRSLGVDRRVQYTADEEKSMLYDPDTKERTQAIAENLMFFYRDALDQLTGRDDIPIHDV